MCYAVIRFMMEFFRGDHTSSFLGMTPSQNIAVWVMFPLGALIFALGWHCYPKQGETHEQ